MRVQSRGFTLIEILAVLVLLGIVAVVVVPQIFGKVTGGKVQAAKVMMSSIEQSLSAFQLDCGFYPSTEQGLEALLAAPTVGKTCNAYDPAGYWKKKDIEKDPWDRPYLYKFPGEQNSKGFDLYSLGPDGTEGTEDDIKAWE